MKIRGVLMLLIMSLGYMATAQTVKLKLRVDDIATVLQTIKQDMVYDVLTVDDKESAVKSCEKVLRRENAKAGTIEVPERYILQWIERNSYYYEDFRRNQAQRNRFLRVANQLYEQDNTLALLNRSNSSGYGQLRSLRKLLLRDLKTDSEKSYEKDEKIYMDDELDSEGNIKPRKE